MSATHATREAWLVDASVILASTLPPIPTPYRVTCGWPSKGARSTRNRVIGECWPSTASSDATSEIFVSPVLDAPLDILATLLHELIHACHPGAGHKGPFARTARAAGLEGKLTATVPGEALRVRLNALAEQLGPYPHARIDASQRKKQGTRLLKVGCSCGIIGRMSKQAIDAMSWTCEDCGESIHAV